MMKTASEAIIFIHLPLLSPAKRFSYSLPYFRCGECRERCAVSIEEVCWHFVRQHPELIAENRSALIALDFHKVIV